MSDVIVATDDSRIVEAVKSFGGKVCMTLENHRSGTDRVAEVARQTNAEIVVNVQGDEPLIDPSCIDAAVEPFSSDPDLMISTLRSLENAREDLYSPNVVKVVTDQEGYAELVELAERCYEVKIQPGHVT